MTEPTSNPQIPADDELVAVLKDLHKPATRSATAPSAKARTKPKRSKPGKKKPAQPLNDGNPGSLICSKCGSPYIVYNGKSRHGKDRVRCADCNKTWNAPPGYVHHKQPANTFILPASPAPPAVEADSPPAEPDESNRYLADLQESLSKLSRKALNKLDKLLDDSNARVQMQAALGAIRSTVQALTRDTSSGGAGAEIHIHTSAQAVVTGPQASEQAQGPPGPGEVQPVKRVGHPIMIVK